MSFNAKFHLNSVEEMLSDLNLEENGLAQQFFTNEVWRLSDDYVPYENGLLKTNVIVKSNSLTYNSPYARYHWYGNLMVDPDYLKGAMFNPNYGFWSRPGVPKILDPNGRAINNWNGLRGPFWTSRMWADRHKEIELAVQKFIERGGK